MAKSFFSRISDYAVGFMLGIASGYAAKTVGEMVVQRLGLKGIGEWGIIGLGVFAMFLAGRFIVRAFMRVIWPFYLGLAIGVAMSTGLIEKLGSLVGMAKAKQATGQSQSGTPTGG